MPVRAAAQTMGSRSHRRVQHIDDLRHAIDCLPVQTRIAMLDGVSSNEIIVGAYVDRRGGVCPMLAAHRCGGRTNFLSFAKSWDRFTGARGRARRATRRELNILIAHLETSLLREENVRFGAAIAEHRELVERRAVREEHAPIDDRVRPGDSYRERELTQHEGRSWLRVFRRLDDYERALSRVEAEREALLAERSRHGFNAEPERQPELV